MAGSQKTTLRIVPAPPAIGKKGEKCGPGMRETIFAMLQRQEFGPIKSMGQAALDELAGIISDPEECAHYRQAAISAIREMVAENESLDARKALKALREAARHEGRYKEIWLSAALAFREISGMYPSQCNTYHYKEDRD
ncbi:MAG TPA: hypothetical protein PKJ97_00095 [Candidatus Bilamarchaeaceae archaeon]|nr:hypothetical protein [Candidatus Bilamarchaeaceae archaeon]